MDPREPTPRVVRFGVFELDRRSGELRKDGVRVRLQEQPLKVLDALLAEPGEPVTREALRQRLWPDDTFVDFDNGLNRAINRLRGGAGRRGGQPAVHRDAGAARLSLHRAGGRGGRAGSARAVPGPRDRARGRSRATVAAAWLGGAVGGRSGGWGC